MGACRLLTEPNGDQKNFHAWKYRSWLARQLQLAPFADLLFTKQLLQADPSNFSAWHVRMVALTADHVANMPAATAASTAACQADASASWSAENRSSAAPQAGEVTAAAAGPTACSQSRGAGLDQGPAQERVTEQHTHAQHQPGMKVVPLPFGVIEDELKFLHAVCELCPVHMRISCWAWPVRRQPSFNGTAAAKSMAVAMAVVTLLLIVSSDCVGLAADVLGAPWLSGPL